jgi:hypothetical protein
VPILPHFEILYNLYKSCYNLYSCDKEHEPISIPIFNLGHFPFPFNLKLHPVLIKFAFQPHASRHSLKWTPILILVVDHLHGSAKYVVHLITIQEPVAPSVTRLVHSKPKIASHLLTFLQAIPGNVPGVKLGILLFTNIVLVFEIQ